MAIDDRGHAIVGVAWAFFALSLTIVVTRMYVRAAIIRKFTIDDVITIFVLLLSLGNSVFLTVSATFGLGQHFEVLLVDPTNIINAVKWVYVCTFFSLMTPCFGRIAFALMLISLLPPKQPVRRWLLRTIILLTFLVDFTCVIITFAQCRPVQAFYDGRPNPNCWPKSVQQDYGYFQTAFGSLVDLILAIFPATLFWNLNMEFRQKVALSGSMGLGIFAMVASIVKGVHLKTLTKPTPPTYEMATLAIWWTLEANLVLIAATIPTLRPLFKSNKGSTKGASANSINTYNSWKRGPNKTLTDGQGPFKPLHERSDSLGASLSDNPPRDLEEIPMSKLPGYNGDSTDGIRRDITVSVTYGQAKMQ